MKEREEEEKDSDDDDSGGNNNEVSSCQQHIKQLFSRSAGSATHQSLDCSKLP